MTLTMTKKLKFERLTSKDINNINKQIDNINDDLSNYDIKSQGSIHKTTQTCTWYSAEVLLKSKYGLWNQMHFLSLDGCTTFFEIAKEYVKELNRYIKYKILTQQIKEL